MEIGEERCETLGKYIVRFNSTVRKTAEIFGISKSTVHKDVTEILENVNNALAKEVRTVLNKNKSERHIRGGEATRQKYEKQSSKTGEKKNKSHF